MRLYIKIRCARAVLLFILVVSFVFPAWAAEEGFSLANEEDPLIEDDMEFRDGGDSEDLVIESGNEELDTPISGDVASESETADETELSIEEGDDEIDFSLTEDTASEEKSMDNREALSEIAPAKAFSLKVDDIWAEAGHFYKSDSPADQTGYVRTRITAGWMPQGNWEIKLSGRLDSYHETGGNKDYNRTRLDYDESFIRYRGEGFRATVGAQKVIWGRIDEVSPTDRLSVPDFSRGVLDYLEDRRRAAPVVRLEGFRGKSKLDMVWLPLFRKATLPGQRSVWHPIDKEKGEILGLESTPAMSAIVKNADIDTNGPDTQGGGGIRYSVAESTLDYAVTVQRVRQSTPYFRFDSNSGDLEAKYPLSWVYGGDIGIEALGATWRAEVAWISDMPVTRTNGRYTTTSGINWATAVEFYPGDSDARLVFQLLGTNLVDAPDVIDRESVYLFNGEASVPFLHDRWRFRNRFFIGLDKRDVYINPEIAFIAWEPHEIYLAAHYFEGDSGTVGDFYEDDSLLTLGWRADF